MEIRSTTARYPRFSLLPLSLLLVALLFTAPIHQVNAATATTITAYQAQTPVKLDGVVSPGEWSDTPLINELTSGMTVAFKHNSTGLSILLQWQQMTFSGLCADQYCYGGVEFGILNNTGPMGSSLAPTIMLLLSPSFKGGYDEFVSRSEAIPVSVESSGFNTQSTCVLNLSGTTYTAECYRPFHLTNPSPYDPFSSLVAGSPIEIGFAVGEFSQPGLHAATDMSTYLLTLSSQTYSSSTSSSTSTSTSSTGATSSTTSSSASSITTSSTTPTTTSTASTTTSSSSSFPISYLAIVGVGVAVLAILGLSGRATRSRIRPVTRR